MSELEQTRLEGVHALLDVTFDRMSKALADLQVFDAAHARANSGRDGALSRSPAIRSSVIRLA
jgi:hypothetical protein